MQEKTFKNWTTEDIHMTFGVQQIRHSTLLEQWLTATYDISNQQKIYLERLQSLLQNEVESWNEEELKFNFIAPLMSLVNFSTPYYKPFLERSLSAVVKEYTLKGRVDFMIATGLQTPRAPYFCLHEYKKEHGIDNDPRGQLLAEMIAIQSLNNNDFPVYGTYVVGRLWLFVVLYQQEYAVSLAYDATKNDLYNIFVILQQLKVIIEGFITASKNK